MARSTLIARLAFGGAVFVVFLAWRVLRAPMGSETAGILGGFYAALATLGGAVVVAGLMLVALITLCLRADALLGGLLVVLGGLGLGLTVTQLKPAEGAVCGFRHAAEVCGSAPRELIDEEAQTTLDELLNDRVVLDDAGGQHHVRRGARFHTERGWVSAVMEDGGVVSSWFQPDLAAKTLGRRLELPRGSIEPGEAGLWGAEVLDGDHLVLGASRTLVVFRPSTGETRAEPFSAPAHSRFIQEKAIRLDASRLYFATGLLVESLGAGRARITRVWPSSALSESEDFLCVDATPPNASFFVRLQGPKTCIYGKGEPPGVLTFPQRLAASWGRAPLGVAGLLTLAAALSLVLSLLVGRRAIDFSRASVFATLALGAASAALWLL